MISMLADKSVKCFLRAQLLINFLYTRMFSWFFFSKSFRFTKVIVTVSLVLTGLIGWTHVVDAVSIDSNGVVNAIITALSWVFLKVGELFIGITVFFLDFFIEIAAYNNFSGAPPVLIGWFMIRDLANMFFVIMLLVIAFGTILGLEQYEWKKTLAKLILAAILINFSKLIAQVIIDGAHVFTITFLNAIAATAGGNLINMFSLDDLLKILPDGSNNPESLRLDIFAASLMVLFFSIVTMLTMGAYLVVLIARMVVLWTLVILSPLAYLLSVLPQTKSYAQEYWNEFTNYVIVAPLMVFFLWLAFASFGAGNIAQQIDVDPSIAGAASVGTSNIVRGLPQGEIGETISLSKATSWENMSSFMIAIAFLIGGIERVQRLGVKGGGLTQSAVNFGKNVVTIASGYAAGRWLVDQGADFGKDYGTLLKGATVDRARNVKGLREIPILGAASKVRRKAAVSKLNELNTLREERYKAEGGGLASTLGLKPGRRTVERARLEKTEAERLSSVKKLEAENVESTDMIESQKVVYKKKVKASEKAYKEKHGLGEDDDIPVADHVNMQLQAAKGLSIFESRIREEQAEIEKGKGEEQEKQVFGNIKLGHILGQQKEYDKRSLEVARRTIGEKVQTKLNANNWTINDDHDVVDADGNIVQRDGEGLTRDRLREGVVKGLTKKDRAKMRLEAAKGLTYFELFAEQGKAGQKVGKAAAQEANLKAIVGDQLRLEEGKDTKKLIDWEEGQYREEMEEWGQKSDKEVLDEIEVNYKARQRELAKPRNERDAKALKNAYQGQMRAVASAMERGYGNYIGKILTGLDDSYKDFAFDDPRNKHLTLLGLTTGKSLGELVALDNDGNILEDADGNIADQSGAVAAQTELGEGLREKRDVLFRIMMKAASKSVKDHGHFQDYYQFTEGINESGEKQIGFANLMKAGIGSSTQLGTGSTQAGPAFVKGYQTGELLPNWTATSSGDGRAYVRTEVDSATGREHAVGFYNNQTRKAAMEIAGMSEQEIKKLKKSTLNFLSGGDYGNSSLKLVNGEVEFYAGEMADNFRELLQGFSTRLASASGDVAKERVRDSVRAFLDKLNPDDPDLQIDFRGYDEAAIDTLLGDLANRVSNTRHYTPVPNQPAP